MFFYTQTGIKGVDFHGKAVILHLFFSHGVVFSP
nr:MAG TPA: hypothetical protein [Caudoviricetes sp.]